MTLIKTIWGKAKRIKNNGKTVLIYHPLICHLLDVAAVTEVFWDEILSNHLKRYLSRFFNGNEQSARAIISFIAGIHDIGKATPVFQAKVQELAENVKKLGLNVFSDDCYHSVLSGKIFQYKIQSKVNLLKNANQDLLNLLKYTVAGHHGSFPKASDFFEVLPEQLGNAEWQKIQDKLIEIVASFCDLDSVLEIEKAKSSEELKTVQLNSLAIFLSGLISVVDWIGSNETFFDFFVDFRDDQELKDKYFELSRKRAKKALMKIGWIGWHVDSKEKPISFKSVFPFIDQLRPLQEEVYNHRNELVPPALVIIEAPMGEGKTEAALYLEYYLETNKTMQGSYIALPTQATANQMFQRVEKFLSQVKKNLRVNLHLLHGNAMLSDEYEVLKTKSKNFSTEESNVVADEWFSYRKRGLISPFGVGTVDQIMLSVLPLRHFFVRLFALAGKTIVIDEVHSYDVYMSTILEDLVSWLHYLGATVILLSATLPSHKRKKMINSFYSEGRSGDRTYVEVAYPRLMICTEEKVQAYSFDTTLKKIGKNAVQIDWIEEDSIKPLLESKMKEGGSVAIICNKIRRAQELYDKFNDLEDEGFEIDVLHSRFPFNQRKSLEEELLAKYGKRKNHRENPKLLISTQIIEQSLDLDFDLMISDLAPIDLLFQRMGRLHRHVLTEKGELVKRPNDLKIPCFHIIKPKLDENGIPRFNYPIYSEYILLMTFLHLYHKASISIPDDLEPMIEFVYSDSIEFPLSFQGNKKQWMDAFDKSKLKRDDKDEMMKLSASYKLIPNPRSDNFFGEFSEYLKDKTNETGLLLHSLTRIISPSIELVCCYEKDGLYYLDQDHESNLDFESECSLETAKEILNHSVRISNYALYKHFIQKSVPKSWKRNTLLRNLHPVKLSKDEDNNAYFFKIPENCIYLNKKLGLIIKKEKKMKNR